jgi:Glycosyl transferases group 1
VRVLLIYKSAPWIETHVIPTFYALPAHVDFHDIRGRNNLGASMPPAHRMAAAISRDGGYDLIFMIEGTDDSACLDALSRARRNGSIICNYLVDVPQEWWKSIDIAGVCNFVLVAQKENANRLKRVENEVIYFPFAVSEQFIRTTCPQMPDHTLSAIRHRAVFLGSAHSRWRWKLLSELDKAEVPIDVIGQGWLSGVEVSRRRPGFQRIATLLSQFSARHQIERLCGSGGWSAVAGGFIHNFVPMPKSSFKNVYFHGFLEQAAMNQFVRYAAVNISTSVHGSGYLVGCPKRQFKLRDIEAPCLDSPFLTDGSPELVELLEPGRHFVQYNDKQELIKLARDACRFPDRYRDFARKAREQIMRRHTWTVRLAELTDMINLELLTSSPA